MIYLAPMMSYTNGWFRSMIQALHPNVIVMTEMITLQALKHAPLQRTLWCHPLERDTILQVASGSILHVEELQQALIKLPFQHINLNAGCPSDRVEQGLMGAVMMLHPELTTKVLTALLATKKTISIKTRLGVNDQSDSMWEEWLQTVLTSGVKDVFLHARQALLNGINPSQNRTIPPLRYERVLSIAKQYPEINWVINGGLNDIETIQELRACSELSGVMLGRVAYQCPMIFWQLAKLDNVADLSRLDRWFETVADKILCAQMITALLALTQGLENAKKIRNDIVEHKGKVYHTGPLKDLMWKTYI